MKATVRTADLVRALARVEKVRPGQTPLPILHNVLVHFVGRIASFTTTNLSQSMIVRIDALVGKNGKACIDCSTLKRAASRAKSRGAGAVELERVEKDLVLRYGKTEVKVTGVPSKEFPVIGKVQNGQKPLYISASVLRDRLQRISPAISTEQARFTLTKAYLTGTDKEETALVATDGRRLIKCRLAKGRCDNVDALIDSGAVGLLLSLIDKKCGAFLSIRVFEGGIRFAWDDTELYTIRDEDAKFPDYKHILGEEFSRTVRLDRDELQDALETVADVTTREFCSVTIAAAKGKVTVSTQNENAEARETLQAKKNGKKIEIVVNPLYLMDALGVLDPGPVELEMNEPTDPMAVSSGWDPEFIRAIVMPIKV